MNPARTCRCGCGAAVSEHRYYKRHHKTGGPSPADRFWAKVDKSGECWLWTGSRSSHGYGTFWDGQRTARAHRFAYTLLVGAIPEGLDLDHLCRNRACVNLSHLEPVTRRVNTLRSPIALPAINALKTHCKRGHEYTPENTLARGSSRACRECTRQRFRALRRKRKAEKLAEGSAA